VEESAPTPKEEDKSESLPRVEDLNNFPQVLITNHRFQSLKVMVRYTARDVRVEIFERTDPADDLTQLIPERTYKFDHPKKVQSGEAVR